MVLVAFQSAFSYKMHQNSFFFKLFLTSAYQNDLKTQKKKN